MMTILQRNDNTTSLTSETNIAYNKEDHVDAGTHPDNRMERLSRKLEEGRCNIHCSYNPISNTNIYLYIYIYFLRN